MTCIVGIADGTTVHMGADSMVNDGSLKSTLAEGKLWKSGELLFGGCGNMRPIQVLRHKLIIPLQDDTQDVDEYLASSLMDAIVATLDEAGLRTKQGQIRGGGGLMLGYRGTLYSIGPDLFVCAFADQYGADGSGRDYALGSLHSSTGTPRKRLERALQAAAYHELHVAPPFVIQSV